jgi:hypothetical protein
MERKNMGSGVVTRSKSQQGKKKLKAPVLKPKRVARPKKNKARDVPALSDSSESCSADEDYAEFLKIYDPHESYSSGSDEIEADYAELLKNYDPQESYPQVSSLDAEESQITVESKGKEILKPLKAASDSD